MNHYDKTRELALALLRCDSESDVISVLTEVGYWEDRNLWRLYGDKEGNFAQVGNQQSLPEASLVEKIVNSGDARLLNECLLRGINPESSDAPRSLRDAVARFFEGKEASDDEAGSLVNWSKAKRTEESRHITIAATGSRPRRGHRKQHMCLTIADQGEGQSPERLPHTILSLNAKNKQSIRFVQGKFNMGGSGALRFCGHHGLQLVISRRNPELVGFDTSDSSADLWSVTVVRREEPSDKSGDPIHSEFTYLAPLRADKEPRRGSVLRFAADSMPLMPKHDEAYAREVTWGTAIKLYEFETQTKQSNILMPDGLLYALERLLPGISLPVRLHECRGYKGEKERSFETPLSGLITRLEDGKGDNLEDGFPLTVKLRAAQMNMTARIYAFKEAKAKTYLRDEGVIFTISGQAHGYLPKSIFGRPKAVGLPRLKDSLLVLVDCSTLKATQREDLFMTSRDRLSKKPIRDIVEREIEQVLKASSELKQLQNHRKEQDVESRLSEEKPLEEVLGKVLNASPTLKTLFLMGQRLAKPFPGTGGGGSGGAKTGTGNGKQPFKGRPHPTYFRIPDHDSNKPFARNCEQHRRVRVKFETDVENGYFDRATDMGRFELELVDAPRDLSAPDYSLTLEDGAAHLNMALPSEAAVGDVITLQASVIDPTINEPLVSMVRLTIMAKHERKSGEGNRKHRTTGGGTTGQQSESGIQLPHVVAVHEGDSNWAKHGFTSEVACHVISDPIEVDGKELLEHTFFVNVDNTSLRTEMKHSRQDPRLLEAKFKYGNVLIGLAILHDSESKRSRTTYSDDDRDPESAADKIRSVSQAVAPVLLPMIDQLSGLDEHELEEYSTLGEDG